MRLKESLPSGNTAFRRGGSRGEGQDNKALQRLSVRPGYPDGRVLEGAGVVPGAAFRAQDERGGFRNP